MRGHECSWLLKFLVQYMNKCRLLKWTPWRILAISRSRFHQIIRNWIFLKFTQTGVLKNVQDGISRPLRSREIQKTKVGTVLVDTLYVHSPASNIDKDSYNRSITSDSSEVGKSEKWKNVLTGHIFMFTLASLRACIDQTCSFTRRGSIIIDTV